MNNATRRALIERKKQSGFPGSIIDVFRAYDQGVDLIGQFQQQQAQQMQVANTPQQQQQGLRPAHQAGNTNASMAFPNQPPNASFNTVGMKAPINLKQYDPRGNLVKSYEAVPPGVTDLKMSSQGGTVIETPAQMQSGGVRKYQTGDELDTLYVDTPNHPRIQQYADSLSAYDYGQNLQTDASQYVDDVLNYYNSLHPNSPFSKTVVPYPHDPNSQYGPYTGFTYKGLAPSHDVYQVPLDGNGNQTEVPTQHQTIFTHASYPIWDKPKQPVVFRPGFETLNPTGPSQINQSQPTPSLQTGYRSTPRTRPSQTVYKQDPTVSTGQYPIGEDIWNPEKRQWRRDLWDAEMQRDSRELAIPRGYKKGGMRKYFRYA